jgi:hypothetical protein
MSYLEATTLFYSIGCDGIVRICGPFRATILFVETGGGNGIVRKHSPFQGPRMVLVTVGKKGTLGIGTFSVLLWKILGSEKSAPFQSPDARLWFSLLSLLYPSISRILRYAE